MIFTTYDKITGKVLSIVNCPEDLITWQYDSTTTDHLEGSFLDKYYIDVENKNPVLKSEKPSEYHNFNYDTKQWEDTRTTETEWNKIRISRNIYISNSDWTQLPDVPLTTKEAWATYRQALRDITLQTDPFNITWPTAPQ